MLCWIQKQCFWTTDSGWVDSWRRWLELTSLQQWNWIFRQSVPIEVYRIAMGKIQIMSLRRNGWCSLGFERRVHVHVRPLAFRRIHLLIVIEVLLKVHHLQGEEGICAWFCDMFPTPMFFAVHYHHILRHPYSYSYSYRHRHRRIPLLHYCNNHNRHYYLSEGWISLFSISFRTRSHYSLSRSRL